MQFGESQKIQEKPAVLITAYKPDPLRWDETFTRRLKNEGKKKNKIPA